jgi:2-C-methyl-D-erythritol 4-phosphate cytidylyltransferase
MDTNAKVTALIPAAGMGKRMGRPLAKQFLPLGDKPMLAHTLLAFQRSADVDEIIPILSKEDMELCLKDIIERYHVSKVKTLVVGGKERQDSVYQGLQKLGEDGGVVIVHDGVRPFVTDDMIRETVDLARKGECVVVGVPLKDTVKDVDECGFVRQTLERSRLWAVQTPQVFPAKALRRAYDEAYSHGFFGTDDAMLAERAGYKVRVIMGSYENIKITTPGDLVIAEEILRKR